MENEKSCPMREGCPYRSIAPQRFKILRGNVIYMDTEINQDLSAVPTGVILKISGSIMRIFQRTCFRRVLL